MLLRPEVNLRTLTVSSPLKRTDGVHLAYMSTNVLRKTNGEIAKGVQNATLTVRRMQHSVLNFTEFKQLQVNQWK